MSRVHQGDSPLVYHMKYTTSNDINPPRDRESLSRLVSALSSVPPIHALPFKLYA